MRITTRLLLFGCYLGLVSCVTMSSYLSPEPLGKLVIIKSIGWIASVAIVVLGLIRPLQQSNLVLGRAVLWIVCGFIFMIPMLAFTVALHFPNGSYTPALALTGFLPIIAHFVVQRIQAHQHAECSPTMPNAQR